MLEDDLNFKTASSGVFNGDNSPSGEFTGVWIPAEVMLSAELSPSEKLAYANIASFRAFFGSNAWLAKRLGVGEVRASQIVSSLVAKGFIRRGAGAKGQRVLKAVRDFDRPAKPAKASTSSNKAQQGASTAKDDCLIIKASKAPQKSSTRVESAKPEEHGNAEVNEAFARWEEIFGVAQKPSAANRYAAWNMIRTKDKGVRWLENTMQLAKAAQSDKYAGRKVNANSGFADIQANWPDIWLWGRRQAEAQRAAGGSVEDMNEGDQR